MPYYTRNQLFFKAFSDTTLTEFLICNPTTIRYLTDYNNPEPGERLFLLIASSNKSLTLVLNRLFPQPDHLALPCEVLWYDDGDSIIEIISRHLTSHGTIGIDKEWRSEWLLELMEYLPQAQFTNASPLVDNLRAVKSHQEQEILMEASRINDQVMQQLIRDVSLGLSEKELEQRLKSYYQAAGAQGYSFDPIIAYGANGANPHHLTSDDYPKIGQSVILDIGCYYNGYASDMTRTVFYGSPCEKAQHLYEIVKQANLAAIQAVKPGALFCDIDKAARDVIAQAGYAKYFTHRTGHSIGMEVHEKGDVSSHNQEPLQVGNVFSIEPGIYIPGELGIRIEDLVIVTPDGCQLLNHVSKELTICSPQDT